VCNVISPATTDAYQEQINITINEEREIAEEASGKYVNVYVHLSNTFVTPTNSLVTGSEGLTPLTP
jgi:hypothetical protein